MTADRSFTHAVVIGAGFCGLTAAHELVKRGLSVTLMEQEQEIGGLAGSFTVAAPVSRSFITIGSPVITTLWT